MDLIYGKGWSARQREEKRLAAIAEAEAEAAYAQWAAANPEEVRKEEEKRRKESEAYWARRQSRGSRTTTDNVDSSAYWAGYDAANKIGIDLQTSGGSNVPRLK